MAQTHPSSARPPVRQPPKNQKEDIDLALSELGVSGSPADDARKHVAEMYSCRDDVLWAVAQVKLPQSDTAAYALRESLANSMAEVYINDFMSSQVVDEASLKQRYEQYKKDLGRTEYELWLITVGRAGDAEAVMREYASCKDFALVARKHSTDSLASQGGYVGWVADGALDADIRQMLARLQRFQISTPIRAPEGLHMLMIEATRPAKPAAFADVRAQLEEAARAERLGHHLTDLRRRRLQERREAPDPA